MNIYQKLAIARVKLKESGLKPTGKNKFANYDYFELSDLLPRINQIEKELSFISLISFDKETATMTIVNADDPTERIIFTSPLAGCELKGCHEVQNLGAVQTYVRRYLYNTAYEVVECDALNATQGADNEPKKAEKKPFKKAQAEDEKSSKAEFEPLSDEELKSAGVSDVEKTKAWIFNQYEVESYEELSKLETAEIRQKLKKKGGND